VLSSCADQSFSPQLQPPNSSKKRAGRVPSPPSVPLPTRGRVPDLLCTLISGRTCFWNLWQTLPSWVQFLQQRKRTNQMKPRTPQTLKQQSQTGRAGSKPKLQPRQSRRKAGVRVRSLITAGRTFRSQSEESPLCFLHCKNTELCPNSPCCLPTGAALPSHSGKHLDRRSKTAGGERQERRGERPATSPLLPGLGFSCSRSSRFTCLWRRSPSRPQGCSAVCTYSSPVVSWGHRRRRCSVKLAQDGHCWCWAHHSTAPHSHEPGFCSVRTGLVLSWNRDGTGSSAKESLSSGAILETPAPFVNSSVARTTGNQQPAGAPRFPARQRPCQVGVSLQRDLPGTQRPFLPGRRASGESWQEPTPEEALSTKSYWETLTWSSLAAEVLPFQTSPVSCAHPEGALVLSSQRPFWPLCLLGGQRETLLRSSLW